MKPVTIEVFYSSENTNNNKNWIVKQLSKAIIEAVPRS